MLPMWAPCSATPTMLCSPTGNTFLWAITAGRHPSFYRVRKFTGQKDKPNQQMPILLFLALAGCWILNSKWHLSPTAENHSDNQYQQPKPMITFSEWCCSTIGRHAIFKPGSTSRSDHF